MNTFEQLINTGDCFTQVSLYQLLREDGRVFIFVHKILAAAGIGSFMAHPTHLVGRHKDEYVGSGKSRDEALRDCLARIKGVPTKDMADVQSQYQPSEPGIRSFESEQPRKFELVINLKTAKQI